MKVFTIICIALLAIYTTQEMFDYNLKIISPKESRILQPSILY